MLALIVAYLSFGLVALLVVGFVAYPYRGRRPPRAGRLSDAVAAMAERVDPGEAPPHGVLTVPEKSRRISARFENVERTVRRAARVFTPSRGDR